MTTILNDLYLYEIILLVVGALLVMSSIMWISVSLYRKDRVQKRLFLLIFIGIIMMSYPSIKEITISGDKIALKKYSIEPLIDSVNSDQLYSNTAIRLIERQIKKGDQSFFNEDFKEAENLYDDAHHDIINFIKQSKQDLIEKPDSKDLDQWDLGSQEILYYQYLESTLYLKKRINKIAVQKLPSDLIKKLIKRASESQN